MCDVRVYFVEYSVKSSDEQDTIQRIQHPSVLIIYGSFCLFVGLNNMPFLSII